MMIGLLILVSAVGCESDRTRAELDQVKRASDESLRGQVISRVEWSRNVLSTDVTTDDYVIHFRDGGTLTLSPHKRHMSIKQEGIRPVGPSTSRSAVPAE